MDRLKSVIAVILFSAACFLYSCTTGGQSAEGETDNVIETESEPETEYIAHAGGIYLGYRASNSLEALTDSAERGYNLIEVDILTTSDGHYVLNHDWEIISNRAAFAENIPVDLKTFADYKIYNKFTTVSLDGLIKFLDEYKNVRIVTDTKIGDYSSLYYIKENYGDYLDRFVPQVYAFEDYKTIRELGYKNIIITLYTMPYEVKSDADAVYKKAKELKPYAITLPDELLASQEYIDAMHTSEIRYFVHTINDSARAEELFSLGIRGIYTDNLLAVDYMEYYNEKITGINANIAALPEEEKALLNGCLIYEYGSEICIEDGKASMIYDAAFISPFENAVSGAAFLPLEKTTRYFGTAKNYRYVPASHSIAFEYEDETYSVGAAGFYKQEKVLDIGEKFVCLNDIFTVPDKFFTSVFDCTIVKKDGYIIVSNDKNKDADEITKILHSILT